MGSSDNPFGNRDKSDSRALLNAVIEDFNSALGQTDIRSPSPQPWEKVVSDLSRVLAIGTFRERALALYMRARAYYYSGMYEKAIADLDELIEMDPYGDSIDAQDFPPKRFRAMANIKLGRFPRAEEDLRDQIERLEQGLAGISGAGDVVRRSDDYYWLLVCRHRGDETAASAEQSRLFQ